MKWSKQQSAALLQVNQWLNDPKAPRVFKLFGHAGVGKTTLAQEIASSYKGGAVRFAAFTGKAAMVLRKKGCSTAQTIHSMIYTPDVDRDTGAVSFRLRSFEDLPPTTLVIVDEASMINEQLAQDLLSFNTRLLVMGDPAQLPPVEGTPFFMPADEKPDVYLTEVHRQALDSPIIFLATQARLGEPIAPGWYGNCRVVSRSTFDKSEDKFLSRVDQVLCGRNATRTELNAKLRRLRGFIEHESYRDLPKPGEKLVCISNNRENKTLLNGSQWQVLSCSAPSVIQLYYTSRSGSHPSTYPNSHPDPEKRGQKVTVEATTLELRSLDLEDIPEIEIQSPTAFFRGSSHTLEWQQKGNLGQFDFGYALTVHRAQGSEWNKVLLFDESFAFRDDRNRWRYTGITRSAEKLMLVA